MMEGSLTFPFQRNDDVLKITKKRMWGVLYQKEWNEVKTVQSG